jgi:outer membrane receptor protein involved in Fe transport
VTIYLDEAPLPYPAMTRLAAFDLARVEVLKGPQGTLYGLNATGGAVNYIAAKPTESFESGVDATYGRFNRAEIGAFVSGPLSDHANARIALQGRRGDAWQESITRPGDRLGAVEELQGRATVEWHANDRLAPPDVHRDPRWLGECRYPVHRRSADSAGLRPARPVEFPCRHDTAICGLDDSAFGYNRALSL